MLLRTVSKLLRGRYPDRILFLGILRFFLRHLLRIRLPIRVVLFLLRLRQSLCLAVNAHKFFSCNGFLFNELRCNFIHHVAVLAEQPERFLIALLQHVHDFRINLRGCIVRTVQRASALQILALNRLQPHQPKLLAHAIARNHGAGDICCLLDIIGRTCRNGVKHNLLCRPAAQKSDNHIMQLVLGIQVFLILRHMHDIPQRPHRARYNRYLLHRLGIFLQGAYQRMPHLVVRYNLALLLAHDAVFLLLADKYHLDCIE